MLHLYQTPTSKYRFYDDVSHRFTLIAFASIPQGYRHFMSDFLVGHSKTFEAVDRTLLASSPTPKSFPDLYPEFFI